MKDTFWIELLDLCRKHGVTEFYSTNQGRPGRVTLTYDEDAQQGEFIISDVGVRTSKPGAVALRGTQCLWVYADNVSIEIVEKQSVRGILRGWISKHFKRIGRF